MTSAASETLARVSEGIVALDDEFRYTYVNRQAVEFLATAEDELLGEKIWDAFPNLGGTDAERQIRQALRTREKTTYERYNEEFGRWFEVRVYPDDDGVSIFFEDITEQKERTRELELYERIIETLPVAVGQTTPGEDGTFAYVNKGMVEMLNAESVSQLEDYRVDQIYADTEHRRDIVSRLGSGEDIEREEVELQTVDGEKLWGSLTATRDETGDAEQFIGIIKNVTGRKQREQELKESERHFEAVFNDPQLLVGLLNTDGTVKRVNDAALTIAGAEAGEIEGELFWETPWWAHNESLQDRLQSLVTKAASGEYVTFEAEHPLPDGGNISVSGNIRPVRDDSSEVMALVASAQDVTDRKERERRLQDQRDGLDLLNQMVRHDIRNNLQVISTYAELLESNVDGSNERHAAKIRDSAAQAVDITRTARDLAETMLQSEDETGPVPLRGTLRSQIDELQTAHPDALFTVDGRLPNVTVRADDMLSSVFRNVLKNAVQHNDEDVPDVTVSVTAEDELVRVTIADNGPGIPDEQKEEMFDRGEKRRESGGTGIGLYLVQTLVEKYGGTVELGDNDPKGTTVTILLDRL